jgi:hypothetical protein
MLTIGSVRVVMDEALEDHDVAAILLLHVIEVGRVLSTIDGRNFSGTWWIGGIIRCRVGPTSSWNQMEGGTGIGSGHNVHPPSRVGRMFRHLIEAPRDWSEVSVESSSNEASLPRFERQWRHRHCSQRPECQALPRSYVSSGVDRRA